MAPSQMEHQQQQTLGQGYTHKKFNCGYSHKKLGLRLRQRDQENKENHQQLVKTNKSSSKNLFRPYALDDNNTPRKRKLSRSSESSEENYSTTPVSSPQCSPTPAYQPQYQQQQPQLAAATPPQTCASPALSPNSYAMRLQRQRAALYMRYMAQMQQQQAAFQAATGYPNVTMGYPNVTAPIYNGC
ncbi:probable basic-leucine zipper transcription factor R [Calliphora vicina]|uniref:probable basic-leucine zipper transcription factor R n=1 Tax=Calliphora vicina TaxID=7373 RepID=UPI00325AAF12